MALEVDHVNSENFAECRAERSELRARPERAVKEQ